MQIEGSVVTALHVGLMDTVRVSDVAVAKSEPRETAAAVLARQVKSTPGQDRTPA
jgi:hypothetical protein